MLPLGETILLWRLARGMTQDGLARASRVPRPNLSAIERGDRDLTLRTLRALALALGVTPGVLADGKGPENAASSPLGRDRLERVAAAAAARGRAPAPAASRPTASEARLADRLAAITTARRGVPQGRRAGRRADRAYLLLRAAHAPETIASLVDRIRVPEGDATGRQDRNRDR